MSHLSSRKEDLGKREGGVVNVCWFSQRTVTATSWNIILVLKQGKLILNLESFWSSLSIPYLDILVNPDPFPPHNLVPENFLPKIDLSENQRGGHLHAANTRSCNSPAPTGPEATSHPSPGDVRTKEISLGFSGKTKCISGRSSHLLWALPPEIQRKRYIVSDIVPGISSPLYETRSSADITEDRAILVKKNMWKKSVRVYNK